MIFWDFFVFSIKITLFENQRKCLTCYFRLRHFPPIFVLLKLTCLVTLLDRKLQFSKTRQIDQIGIITYIDSKCKRSSLRSQCKMRLFLWFSNTVKCTEYYSMMAKGTSLAESFVFLVQFYASGSHALIRNSTMISSIISAWKLFVWPWAFSSLGTSKCTTQNLTLRPKLVTPLWTRNWAKSSTFSLTKREP